MSTTPAPVAPAPAAPPDGADGWGVTIAASAVIAVVLGTFGSVGVLIDPLSREFGVPRAGLVPLFAVALLVHTAAAAPAGAAADRFGPRTVLAVAGTAMTVGLLATATAGDVRAAIAAYGLGMGLASAGAWVATTTAVSSWFDRRRAAAIGVLTAGAAVGGMVIAPAAAAVAAGTGPRAALVALATLGAGAAVL
ncbi:MAG TPA: MFS transporter, partial [Pseudonocardia sp.]|nr:MFS transporter [Pseudonocardia sp.]